MKGNKQWSRAVFTVEAAVIIPLSVIMLALLLGYDYYTHQSVWCKGAACEAALYSMQRFQDGSEAVTKAAERIDERFSEAPLQMGSMSPDTSGGSNSVKVSWEAQILPGMFGSLYQLSGSVSAVKNDPVSLKQLQWVTGELINEE